MEARIRVAIIGIKGLPARAGADRVVEALVRRLPGLGIDPTVFCDQRITPADFSLPGVKIVRVRSLPGKFLNAPTRFLVAAIRAVASKNLDLVHLHNIEASFILPILRLKYPVVSTAHGFAYWRPKWGPLAMWLIKLSDLPFMAWSSRVTSVSEKDAELLRTKYHKEVVYIPNGVGTDFRPDRDGADQMLTSLGLTTGNYFTFVAGRIEPSKGAHLAIEAVNRLQEDFPLLIVGDLNQVPAYRAKLKAIAGSRIHFLEPIRTPELLFGLMACSRCLIFPSSVEAMSMVLLEAASLGVPILASDIEENRSVLGEDVVYFESGSVVSLVERLGWVLQHEAEMQHKSEHARDRVYQNYSWDSIAIRYAELMKDVAGRYGSVNKGGKR